MGDRLILDETDLFNQCSQTATPDMFLNSKVPDWHWTQSIYTDRAIKEDQKLLNAKDEESISLVILENS